MLKSIAVYNIAEHFLSIQGEGVHSGKLALFLRFGKCNLDCDFCDTQYAKKQFERYSINDIKVLLKKFQSMTHFLVITGGEPLLSDIELVIDAAKKMDYYIMIETNGTFYQECLKKIDWITVSPKKAKQPLKKTLRLANELKFVIQEQSDFVHVNKFMPFTPAYLMPVNNKPAQAGLILNYLKKNQYSNNLQLGVQLHKVYHLK